MAKSGDAVARGYRAVENLHHRYLTGIILRTVMTRGTADATEMVFRLFRRQQQEKFLPGLRKLGLDGLPDAVACGQYHYLSNYLGDVKVAYAYESDRKTWVTYPPPRWIWDGTAVCGIPTDVSRAMMRAWHSHNGVALQNPNLGFVCTKQTTDGQPGLEGYFYEYDYPLAPEQRLRFAPEEQPPEFDPEKMPKLDVDHWPEERVRKALRNYAMEYVRNLLPEMVKLFGPDETHHLGRISGKLIGMQYYDETAKMLSIKDRSAGGFVNLLTALGRASGDSVKTRATSKGPTARQKTWKLMNGIEPLSPAVFDAWNGLIEGLLAVHNPNLRLEVVQRLDHGDDCFEWRVRK